MHYDEKHTFRLIRMLRNCVVHAEKTQFVVFQSVTKLSDSFWKKNITIMGSDRMFLIDVFAFCIRLCFMRESYESVSLNIML